MAKITNFVATSVNKKYAQLSGSYDIQRAPKGHPGLIYAGSTFCKNDTYYKCRELMWSQRDHSIVLVAAEEL